MAPQLPYIIITEILSKLPVENLIRFVCVCKAWNELINAPQFGLLQFMNNTLSSSPRCSLLLWERFDQRRTVILRQSNGNWKNEEFSVGSGFIPSLESQGVVSSREDPFELMLKSSCNGLLLCLIRYTRSREVGPLMVYNPITHCCLVLPKSDIDYRHGLLFGFDQITQKFKVILIDNGDSPDCRRVYGLPSIVQGEAKCEILTVGESSWRRLQIPSTVLKSIVFMDGHYRSVFYSKPLFFCGAIHLVVERSNLLDGIFVLNINSEAFHVMKFSPSYVCLPLDSRSYQLMETVDSSLVLVEELTRLQHWTLLPLRMWKIVKETNDVICVRQYATQYLRIRSIPAAKLTAVYPLLALSESCFMFLIDQKEDVGYKRQHLCVCDLDKEEASHIDLPGLPVNFTVELFVPSLICPTAF